MNKMIATELTSLDETFRFASKQLVYHAAEADAVIDELRKAMREAIEFMNGGAYGMAAVTLSAALDPPTSSLGTR